MILPIIAYGDPILRKHAQEIGKSYPNLNELVNNMFETMYAAPGVGLAAPQVGLSVRLIVIDGTAFMDAETDTKDVKRVFINPKITEEEGEEWLFNEGCLSFPGLREDVMRKPNVRIEYYDENFEFHDERFDGVMARIVQHEYDHLEGKVFVDRINPLKKTLLKRRLADISKGDVEVSYKMKFPQKKKNK